MNFGKTILQLRKEHNITQEDLAAELGVTAAAVSKWENGYTLPDILMLCALADFFSVTTDQLLGRYSHIKKAVILAENQELGQKMEALLRENGFQTQGIFTSKEEALVAAQQDPQIKYLVAGMYKGGYFDDSPLQKIVSCSKTDVEILAGLQFALENCLNKDTRDDVLD